MVWDRGSSHGTITHPAGRRRTAKGRGKEPGARRGETHPAAPWSRWAFPRSRFAGGCRLPTAAPRWATLLALVLIKNIKQRYSNPGPRGCAAPGCPGHRHGLPGMRLPLLPTAEQPHGPSGTASMGPKAAGGARRRRRGPAQPSPALPVARGRADVQGTASCRGGPFLAQGSRGSPRPGEQPRLMLCGVFRSVSPSREPSQAPAGGDTVSWQGGPGERTTGQTGISR